MNIKRPSESWEILSDGLWFDWKELFKKTACVRIAHTLQMGFVGLQVGCVPKGTHAVAGYGLLSEENRLISNFTDTVIIKTCLISCIIYTLRDLE